MASEHEEVSNIEKLMNAETFELWDFQTGIFFKASGLFTIVTGEEKIEDLTQDKDKKLWIQKDAKAQKIIITTVDKKLLIHIMNCKSSSEMYLKLKNIFKKETEDQKCLLLQEFFSCQFEKGTDLSTHLSKLQNMAFRLKSLKQDISNEMLMSKILSTLPEKYKYFKTAWESTSRQDKSLDNLIARLLAEENSNQSSSSEKSVVFQSTERLCYIYKKPGHIARYCKNKTSHNKYENKNRDNKKGENRYCSICKKNNHTEASCFFRKREQGENDRKVSFLSECKTQDETNKNIFVMDSGSTSHMVNNKDIFKNLTDKTVEISVAKKNALILAEGVGNVETEKCILSEVLYVPELSKNLLSVCAITENQGKVIFEEDKVYVIKDNKTIFEGNKNEKGLFMIDFEKQFFSNEETEKETFLAETKEEKVTNWHRKLGHMSINKMKKMIDTKMVTGIELNKKDCENFELPCDVCVRAKQSRFPFNTDRTRAKRILEIIHTDLCGPIDPITYDKKRYILTVIDDYTNWTMIYLLEYKNETAGCIIDYIKQNERCKNSNVVKIRCDNGGEYINEELKNYCKDKSIILDTTIPHSPQLNGKAERYNRTLIEKVRSLLIDSETDKKLWGEAARVATYILNRSPTAALSVDKTPAEIWINQKPDLKRMQIFGTEVYAKNLGYLKKLEDRSEKYLFVGYAATGYRLFDEKRKKIIIRRDVIFRKSNNKTKSVNIKMEKGNETEETTEIEESVVIKEAKNEIENNNDPNNLEIQTSIQNNINQVEDSVEDANENSIEYIYEESEEENSDLGQGSNITRAGRKARKPTRFEDYVLLTYEDVMQRDDKDYWQKAMQDEKESLKKNNTWELVDMEKAENKKILTNKWVFRIKDNGTYKARLVVGGCQQTKGLDYDEVFSPVVNINSLRLLLAISVQKDYQMKKFDIKTAFLYGTISEDIYMQIPEGYRDEENSGKICKLKKALYGLKQAPMRWNKYFTNFLKENGLKPLNMDQCIFKTANGTLFLAIYVDDGLIIGENSEEIQYLLERLEKSFEIKKFDKVDSFLGIRITKTKNSIKLDQENYTENLLEKFKMENAKTSVIPITNYEEKSTGSDEVKKFPYREAVGSLLYLSNRTRPDISYAVGYCSRNLENPSKNDINNVKRIFRYLGGTKADGITYQKNEMDGVIEAYSDSDFAGDKQTRKSTTGYVVFYANGPINWCSRKQAVVALSSTEAEFIAAAETVKELLYLKSLLDILLKNNSVIVLHMDNQSALSIIKNGQFNKRSKHIDVRFHFINEKVREGLIQVKYLCSENNVADIFTKALNAVKFQKHKNVMIK